MGLFFLVFVSPLSFVHTECHVGGGFLEIFRACFWCVEGTFCERVGPEGLWLVPRGLFGFCYCCFLDIWCVAWLLCTSSRTIWNHRGCCSCMWPPTQSHPVGSSCFIFHTWTTWFAFFLLQIDMFLERIQRVPQRLRSFLSSSPSRSSAGKGVSMMPNIQPYQAPRGESPAMCGCCWGLVLTEMCLICLEEQLLTWQLRATRKSYSCFEVQLFKLELGSWWMLCHISWPLAICSLQGHKEEESLGAWLKISWDHKEVKHFLQTIKTLVEGVLMFIVWLDFTRWVHFNTIIVISYVHFYTKPSHTSLHQISLAISYLLPKRRFWYPNSLQNSWKKTPGKNPGKPLFSL